MTTIGLTIALSISFQMILFLIGSKGALLESFLTGEYQNGLFGGVINEDEIDLDIGPDFELRINTMGLPSEELDADMEQDIRSIASTINQENFIASSRFCARYTASLKYQETAEGVYQYRDITLLGISQKDFTFLQQMLPISFPELNGSNVLMLFTRRVVSSQIYVPTDLKFNLTYTGASTESEVTLVDVPLDISSYLDSTTLQNILLRRFGNPLISQENIIVLTSLDGITNIMQRMGLDELTTISVYFVNLDVDYTKFSILSENRDLNKITALASVLNSNNYPLSDLLPQYAYARLQGNLVVFFDDYNIIQTIILSLTIPPICIGFFMINFSFNIIRRKNIHHINLLKARGATNRQVFLALFLEMIIATFFALIIGSAIGVSLIFLIGRTSAFLEFKSEIPIAQYSFTAAGALAGIIIISGLVISLIINIPRMISLSRLKVKNVAGEEERKKKPLWQRIYLDSILGILAIISLIVFLVAVNVDFEQDTQMILTLIFGVSAPILVVTSISFVIARFFTRIIQKLGDKLWSIKTGSFALSIKNLTHQNKQTSRAVILIMITLTFGIVSAVVPATIDYNVYQRSAYVFGADIIILNPELDTLYQENIENLEGVEATSLVVLNDQHEEIDFGWGPLPTSIIGIDPDTFLDAAYMKAWKYGFSNRFTNLLNELSVDGNMLYQRDALEEYNLPDRFSVNFGIELYNVVGTFKAFPNLVKDRNYDQTANEKFIVCNLDTANNLMDSAFIYDRNYILYVKQAKPNTARSIINNIQSIYPDANVFSAELDTEQNLKMPARISIYAMLNSSFITTVISTIAGLVIYSLLILFDRSKELSLIRALGAFRKEIYRSFLYESLLMLTIGMVIGIPVGIIVAIILSNVINSYYEIPPLMLKIPWLSLIVILASIYVITTIASLIPAHYAAKKEINDLARTI